MAAEDLKAFLASMSAGGSPAALERYDEGAFSRLDDAEAEVAVAACVDRIASGTNDPRAVGVLLRFFRNDARKAVREALPNLPGRETKAAVLHFLFELEGRSKDLVALGELAVSGQRDGRLEALRLLSSMDEEPEVVNAALARATADPVRDVRRMALFEVFDRADLRGAAETPPSRASSIEAMVLSTLPSVYSEGARLLVEVVGEAASRSVQEPTFSREEQAPFQRFTSSIDSNGPIAFPAAFADRSRAWAEEILLGLADTDERAIPLLADLRSPRADQALEDLVQAGSGAASQAAARMLETRAQEVIATVLAAIDTEASSMSPTRAIALAERLSITDPEQLFQAAIGLASANEAVRRSFADAALHSAPQWATANRADLLLALGLEASN